MTPRFDSPPGLEALTTLVRDCSVSGVPRRVLLLRTDLLPPRLSRPHHLDLLRESLEPLTGAERARSFDLPHRRVAVSWRGEAPDRLRASLETLESVLQDAPLDAPSMPELARLFDLPEDGAALLALASQATAEEERVLAAEALRAAAAVKPAPPLSLPALEAMETQLASASVARFVRRRSVVRAGAEEFALAWENRYLSMNELMTELCPGRNAFANPWLFRRLTRLLDRRMLALLSTSNELRGAKPFSLHLNVSAILSPEFLRFDSLLPTELRGHVVLELHPADVMTNLTAYRFARAYARSRAYRVMLRDTAAALLPALDLAALDLDFAELRWERSVAGLDPAALRAGTTRWVLGRADTEDALRWGVLAGIGLFRGDAATATAMVPQKPPVRRTARAVVEGVGFEPT